MTVQLKAVAAKVTLANMMLVMQTLPQTSYKKSIEKDESW